MAKLVAKTYGEALFEIAMEENKLDLLLEEVEGIRTILEQNPEFDKLMKHPKISNHEKNQVMEEVFKNRISDEMLGFLKLTITKERYIELEAIFQYFISKVKEEKKIGIAFVTSAIALSDSQKQVIKDKLLSTTQYNTVEMHFQIDESLIGGMTIRIKDRVIDSSIKTKLHNVKKQLLQIQLG